MHATCILYVHQVECVSQERTILSKTGISKRRRDKGKGNKGTERYRTKTRFDVHADIAKI